MRQQCQHVAPTVRNDVNEYLFAGHPIDEAIGFEMHLAIFVDTKLMVDPFDVVLRTRHNAFMLADAQIVL